MKPLESRYDEDEFNWGDPQPDDDGEPFPWLAEVGNRRTFAAFGVALLLIVSAFATGGALASTDFTASDVAVTSHNGQLQSLTIAPAGNVSYTGLEQEPSEIQLNVSVRLADGGTYDSVGVQSIDGTGLGLNGSVPYDFATIDLLAESSLQKSDFKASDGQTETTDVQVKVDVTIVGGGPGGGNVTVTDNDIFTVSVTNEPAGGGVGGNANTGAQ